MSISNVDRMISCLKKCGLLKEKEVKNLCDRGKELLSKVPNVVKLDAPVAICGDIHGQFYDVLELFRAGGDPPLTNYVFLGDYVDRGFYSVETFLLLLTLKVRYPRRITLLRGNHESRQITQVYGFYDECLRKFGSMNVWKHCCELFDLLPLVAIIEGHIFCVHGGLSPNCKNIDSILAINRKREIPHDGGMCDLLWSDPEVGVENWALSPRGAGFLFGMDVTLQFCQLNNVSMIARAHQLAMDGYRLLFENKVATVWSAPNYCYRCGNSAAIMHFNSKLDVKWVKFEAAHSSYRNPGVEVGKPDYFL